MVDNNSRGKVVLPVSTAAVFAARVDEGERLRLVHRLEGEQRRVEVARRHHRPRTLTTHRGGRRLRLRGVLEPLLVLQKEL